MNKKLLSIIEAIRAGRCVLVLGPEICQVDYNKFVTDQAPETAPKDFDESLRLAYDYYFNEVLDDYEREDLEDSQISFVDYPFIKEHLMTLKSENDVQHIYDFMKWYFSQTAEWSEHFNKIAQIPFPLVLSLLPDASLEKSFELSFGGLQNGYMVSRYSRENKAVPSIDSKPTAQNPLVYKLLGDLEHYDATFTFDDWFDYFSNIFGVNPLPLAIKSVLKDDPLILFLGVRVEKWYIQVVMRLLLASGQGGLLKGKKFAFVNAKEKNVEDLAKKRLNVMFDEANPTQLLEELYQACRQEKLLRVAQTDTMRINAKVFISYNHADGALADKLRADLEEVGIEVIIDSDNPIGFEIPKFINESIAKADFVLQLISANFLTSAWVAQESVKAFTLAEIMGKVVLPCQIDDALNDNEFRNSAMRSFEDKIKDFGIEMGNRLMKGESIEDLQPQYQRVLELKNNYDKTIAEFRNKNRGDLRGNNYDKGLQQIFASIKKYLAVPA